MTDVDEVKYCALCGMFPAMPDHELCADCFREPPDVVKQLRQRIAALELELGAYHAVGEREREALDMLTKQATRAGVTGGADLVIWAAERIAALDYALLEIWDMAHTAYIVSSGNVGAQGMMQTIAQRIERARSTLGGQ